MIIFDFLFLHPLGKDEPWPSLNQDGVLLDKDEPRPSSRPLPPEDGLWPPLDESFFMFYLVDKVATAKSNTIKKIKVWFFYILCFIINSF